MKVATSRTRTPAIGRTESFIASPERRAAVTVLARESAAEKARRPRIGSEAKRPRARRLKEDFSNRGYLPDEFCFLKRALVPRRKSIFFKCSSGRPARAERHPVDHRRRTRARTMAGIVRKRNVATPGLPYRRGRAKADRKSTRLNSSH